MAEGRVAIGWAGVYWRAFVCRRQLACEPLQPRATQASQFILNIKLEFPWDLVEKKVYLEGCID